MRNSWRLKHKASSKHSQSWLFRVPETHMRMVPRDSKFAAGLRRSAWHSEQRNGLEHVCQLTSR
jgi:hypothetical protein